MSPVWLSRRSFAGKHCPRCKYDLSGSHTGRCPECGSYYFDEVDRKESGTPTLITVSVSALVGPTMIIASIHFSVVISLLFYALKHMGDASPPAHMEALVLILTFPVSVVPLNNFGCGAVAALLAANSLLWGFSLTTMYVTARIVAEYLRQRPSNRGG